MDKIMVGEPPRVLLAKDVISLIPGPWRGSVRVRYRPTASRAWAVVWDLYVGVAPAVIGVGEVQAQIIKQTEEAERGLLRPDW